MSDRNWEYQGIDIHQKEKIMGAVKNHFDKWKEGSEKKNEHPIFCCLTGPGRGKTRLLDEFPAILKDILKEDELKTRIENAYVFPVTFSNGTANTYQQSVEWHIAVRMLWQLEDQKGGFESFCQDALKKDNTLSIIGVLNQLAEGENKELKDLTVVLLVDEINKIQDLDVNFSSLLNGISTIVNSCVAFFIPVLAGTVLGPVKDFIVKTNSKQLFVFVQPPVIDPWMIKKNDSKDLVFDSQSKAYIAVVSDMGRNPRALEYLQKTFSKETDFSKAIGNVGTMLKHEYGTVLQNSDVQENLTQILRVVFGRKKVLLSDSISGSDLKIQDIVDLGLFSHSSADISSEGYLEVPYCFLWLITDHVKELKKFFLPESDHYSATWQNFEEFCCYFRALKAYLWSGEEVEWETLHSGNFY